MHRRNRNRQARVVHSKQITYTQPPLYKEEGNTVIFKWAQADMLSNVNRSYSWGIGDILRGMLATYQLAKENRWNFQVDIHAHPFSALLEKPTMFYASEPSDTIPTFNSIDGGNISSVSINFNDKGVYTCINNAWPKTPVLKDETYLVRSLLVFKPEYRIDISGSYNLFHIRVGDAAMANGASCDNAKYEAILRQYAVPGDVFISDCVSLKRYIATTDLGLRITHTDVKTAHTGYSKDINELIPTAVDMQLIMNASQLYTYSEYDWISGFIHWCGVCFGKKIQNLRK
jgi:hypothetical protein